MSSITNVENSYHDVCQVFLDNSRVITQLLTSLPQHKKVQLRLPPFVEVVELIWAKCLLSPFISLPLTFIDFGFTPVAIN